MLAYIKEVLQEMPQDWLRLTTHRLDIYDESQAKSQFLDEFEKLYNNNVSDQKSLNQLPTAYDYIRLGHPLSSILEWAIAKTYSLKTESVISFQSKTVPVLAVLRKNLLEKKSTRILYTGARSSRFDTTALKEVYGYNFELQKLGNVDDITPFNGSTILLSEQQKIATTALHKEVDFYVNTYGDLGSILIINGENNNHYVADLQHVRRRETVAMTPENTLAALESLVNTTDFTAKKSTKEADKVKVLSTIKEITQANSKALVGSSGLSIQYAIMMGLVAEAQEQYPGKAIKFVVPPNCYGGTNDQARRVAACLDNVEVVDLPVDGDNDMVQSVDRVLTTLAEQDAIPYIIAEIPTNPRVEVPDLVKLKEVLSTPRKTPSGDTAIDPVFILDQTFCPNVHFLGDDDYLSTVRAISYTSGSKFPSGGKVTAGYCVANTKATPLIANIEKHLTICDNEATALQYELLAQQLPSMNQRIADAYVNTRKFVTFISEVLPDAKINFVSEALAQQGFTPSVFSLDLPTKGDTPAQRETYKRALNHKLINLMITKIPKESKYCVSYGQLKGVYWTIPATSTQGTTKEGDKDYIARVSLSPNMDLERHKEIFREFVSEM